MSGDLSNASNIKSSDKTIAELRASLKIIKDKNSGFDEDSYKDLIIKYEKAMEIIEEQRIMLDEYRRNKLPSKDEVDTISSMLDLINKLDDNTLDKISKLNKK